MIDEKARIVIERLRGMPASMRLHIGSYGSFTKDDLIKHVQNEDEIGKKIVNLEFHFLASLKKEIDIDENNSDFKT